MTNRISITKLFQSAFVLSVDDERYAFDFGSETPGEMATAIRPVKATFVSHVHPDHFDIPNLRRLDAPVYSPPDVANALKQEPVRVSIIRPGDCASLAALSVHAFWVDHGPGVSAPIDNLGFKIEADRRSVLFLGDIGAVMPTPEGVFTVVMIPVGGSKVFSAAQAADFINRLGHKGITIPMHYHGRADRRAAEEFRALASSFCDVHVCQVGESVDL